jgi:heparan-alpha-glucosaminide N-acetyltransferase
LNIESRGVYVAAFYNVTDSSAQALLINLVPADASNSPIFIMIFIIIIGSLAVNFVNRTLGWTQDEVRTKSSSRLLSLDTFRGMCLAIMIFVNYGGGGYWFFNHSSWNGLTVADLVFPWFMWIMGVSMALGFKAASSKGGSGSVLLLTSLRRGATLISIGLVLNSGGMDDVRHWRLPGVLQYFGFSYILVSSIVILVPVLQNLPIKKTPSSSSSSSSLLFSVNLPDDAVPDQPSASNADAWSDVRPHALQWIVALMLPVVYVALTWGIAVPGCPAGYLGPGGYADDGQFFNCTGGPHRYIDYVLFGVDHFYHGPTCSEVYNCIFYDPEGFVGAFHAAFLVWLGLVCGRVFVHHKDAKGRLLRLWAWGAAQCLVAACLCGFSKEGGIVPVNKNLWSLSFILLQSGLGNILLSLYYLAVDVKMRWAGNPLRAMGMNSIVLYCGSEILQDFFPFTIPGANTHACAAAARIVACGSH